MAAGHLGDEPRRELLAGVLAGAPCWPLGQRARLHQARTRRVVWPGPAVLVIELVTQMVKRPLPAGGRDVQGLAGRQFDARNDDVDMHPATGVAVQNRKPGVLVRTQTSECCALKLAQSLLNLCRGRVVARRPCQHTAGVPVNGFQAVNQPRYLLWITP